MIQRLLIAAALAAVSAPMALPALADPTLPADESPRRSFELPAIQVEGHSPFLKEEEYIGAYQQPRWTATRAFTTTRAYVAQEGQVTLEGWARTTIDRHADANGNRQHEERYLQEVTIGLPNRVQLDFYLRQDHDSAAHDTSLAGQFEARYALADWGKIWGNPTLYLEYIARDKDNPDVIEPKLLFCGELAPRWHWATNFALEAETGGARSHEWGWSGALAYSVIDSKLTLGAESIIHATDEVDAATHSRTGLTYEFMVGPSMKWKPTPATMVNFTPLVGLGGHSPRAQIYLNVGWEL